MLIKYFIHFSELTKQIANYVLLTLMIGAIYSHWMVDDKLERSAPALVFFFMLSCRLVVEWQLSRKAIKAESSQAAAASDATTTAADSSKKTVKSD